MYSLKENLRFYRLSHGYSQNRLAEELGIPVSAYRLYETGEFEPEENELIKIAQILCISVYELAGVEWRDTNEDNNQTMIRENSVYGSPGRARFEQGISVDEFFRINGKVRQELVYGKLIPMNTPSVIHQNIVGGLYYELRSYIAENGGGCKPFVSPIDVVLSEEDQVVLQPDVVLVCNPEQISERGIEGAPTLVIEVLSPGNRRYDLYQKLQIYEMYGVAHYLIVDPENEKVIVYNLKDQGIPVICGFDESLTIPGMGGMTVLMRDVLGV